MGGVRTRVGPGSGSAVRRRRVAAPSRDGSSDPGDLYLLPDPTHLAGVRVDADQRDRTRRRPRVGFRPEGRRCVPVGDPSVPHHPVGGVHDGVQRPDHPAAPLPRCDYTAGAEEAPDDHHPGPVRPALHRTPLRHRAADRRGPDRVRAAVGRTDRAPPRQSEPADAAAHRQPGRGRTRREVPRHRGPVPDQGLPQGPRTPPDQARRPHRQATPNPHR